LVSPRPVHGLGLFHIVNQHTKQHLAVVSKKTRKRQDVLKSSMMFWQMLLFLITDAWSIYKHKVLKKQQTMF